MSYKITGSGCSIPSVVQGNEAFLNHSFLDDSGSKFDVSNETIIDKFNSITGIEQRKYIPPNLKTSDIAYHAAQKAIEDAQNPVLQAPSSWIMYPFAQIRRQLP